MNQMYSMKYGTIPIVHNVGGLSETVSEYNAEEKTGNGFVFERYTSKEIIRVIKRALKIYNKKALWSELQFAAMKEEFSWNRATEKYLDIYHSMFSE